MERDAVEIMSLSVLVLFDFDAVGIVGPHFVQRHQVRDHQEYQGEGQRGHVQREEPVQGGVRDDVVAADPLHQSAADHGQASEQGHDHLRAPEAHVAPRKHVSHEGLGHQQQEDQTPEYPQQFARLAM